jgi:hypothetical protein
MGCQLWSNSKTTLLVDSRYYAPGAPYRDEIDARNLLEHLVDIRQHRTMEIAVAIELEALPEPALRHLKHNILDSPEFGLNLLVFAG